MPSKAETLRDLHRGPGLVVIPNAWDVASARALAALPRCRAIATTSGGVARALGFEDGERTPADEMIRFVGRIAAAVDVPVTADLEAGYGDPAGTARAAWDAGVVGMNLEDSRGDELVPLDEQVDVFLRQAGGLDDAVERANAYLAAGADCTFPIFAPYAELAEFVERTDGPVNVLARPDVDLAEIARIGVRRVTFGSGLAELALAEAVRWAEGALAASYAQ